MNPERIDSMDCARWSSLGCVMIFIGGFCFAVLPKLARFETVRTRIDFHESKRIEGNATYYTDLEYTRALLKRKHL